MGNAEELLDELLEMRVEGVNLREIPVLFEGERGWQVWSGEVEVIDSDLCMYSD